MVNKLFSFFLSALRVRSTKFRTFFFPSIAFQHHVFILHRFYVLGRIFPRKLSMPFNHCSSCKFPSLDLLTFRETIAAVKKKKTRHLYVARSELSGAQLRRLSSNSMNYKNCNNKRLDYTASKSRNKLVALKLKLGK